DPALGEAYGWTASVRRSLLDLDFQETVVPADPSRACGLRDLERLLFDNGSMTAAPPARGDGLTVLGAPEGEGLGLVLAREIRRLLEAESASPDDILVLFPRWDADARLVCDVIASWGLPIWAGSERMLATEPVVAALLQAITIPVRNWDTPRLVRLLRNGRLRPPWVDLISTPETLAEAASAVQATRVFRGRDPLLKQLRNAAFPDRSSRKPHRRAQIALPIVERILDVLQKLDQPRPWRQ